MKLFHIRLDAPGYSSDGIANAIKELGFEYSGWDWQKNRFNLGLQAARLEMIRQANEAKADYILAHIQTGEFLDIDTAKELSKYGFVINYTFDVRNKANTEWMYQMAPHIGLTVFACKDDVEECRARGINNVMFLHSSADFELYKPQLLPEEVVKTYAEIVFIGNDNSRTNLGFEDAMERVNMVEFLTKTYDKRFKAYGMGWPRSTIIYPMEEINIYNSAKIVITQNEFKRKNYCSDRQWRSIACGAFTICQFYDGLEDDFYDSQLFSWSDFDNLKEQIDFYLENEAQREVVSLNQGQEFFEKHTWLHRITSLLSKIKSLKITNV